MAINSNTTQRRLVSEIKEWAESHQMINRFGYGDFLELYSNSENSFPYFTLNIKDATSSQWYFNFTLDLCVLGWLYDNKEGQLDSESELIEILRDFQNTVKESPRWNSFSRLQGDMTLQKVLEKGGDKALAWCGRITIQIKKTSGFCSLSAIMPEYDFESGTVITPSCAPVSIFEDMIFKEFVPSGGEFYYTTGGGDATQIIKDSDNNTLYTNVIPSGDTETQIITDATVTNSDASYNANILAQGSLVLPDVTNTDSDGSSVVTPAQTPFVCTPAPSGISSSVFNTGQEIIYRTGDDGDRFQNGDYASVYIADISDYYTLVDNNEWGHKKRFTGDTGGYMDEATGLFYDSIGVATTKALAFPNDIMRDYCTRSRWYLNRSGARTWDDAVTLTRTELRGGEIGWFCPNRAEYNSLISDNADSSTFIDSRLFNWSSFTMWCSTTNKSNPLQSFRFTTSSTNWDLTNKTVVAANSYVKIF